MTVRTCQTPQESLDRLVACAREEVGSPTWWGLRSRHVDELRDELRDELAMGDVEGLAAQIIADAPHLAASAARLPLLEKRVKSELTQLRILVAHAYGSTTAAAPVRDAVEVALRHVPTLNNASTQAPACRTWGAAPSRPRSKASRRWGQWSVVGDQ